MKKYNIFSQIDFEKKKNYLQFFQNLNLKFCFNILLYINK